MMDQNERSAAIQIGGETYELLLTTKATKEIAKRYGGLENLGTKLMKSENFEMALDEIIWLIALMANQSILIYNLRHTGGRSAIRVADPEPAYHYCGNREGGAADYRGDRMRGYPAVEKLRFIPSPRRSASTAA